MMVALPCGSLEFLSVLKLEKLTKTEARKLVVATQLVRCLHRYVSPTPKRE